MSKNLPKFWLTSCTTFICRDSASCSGSRCFFFFATGFGDAAATTSLAGGSFGTNPKSPTTQSHSPLTVSIVALTSLTTPSASSLNWSIAALPSLSIWQPDLIALTALWASKRRLKGSMCHPSETFAGGDVNRTVSRVANDTGKHVSKLTHLWASDNLVLVGS